MAVISIGFLTVLRSRSRPFWPEPEPKQLGTLFRLRLRKVSYKSIFIISFFFVNNDIFITTQFLLNEGIFITTNSFLNIVNKCFFKVIVLAAQGYVCQDSSDSSLKWRRYVLV